MGNHMFQSKENFVNIIRIMNKVYVDCIRKNGFDLFINGKKIFVSFEELPIFKEVQLQDIFNVNFFGEDALEWKDADIHIPIDALIHPKKYIQRFPAKHINNSF